MYFISCLRVCPSQRKLVKELRVYPLRGNDSRRHLKDKNTANINLVLVDAECSEAAERN